jgi:phosphatidylglycerol:prolipoprotein diacylglycerol transferase
VIGGFIALLVLARKFRMSSLLMLDVAATASALGYGVGRIGCLISGDGDYGIPTSLPWGMSFPNGIVPTNERVHPTPIYEFLIGVAIFWILWRLGARLLKERAPDGLVFAAYLVLSGIARFLIEIIRINPRSFYGLTNAQAASVVSIIGGVILFASLRRGAPAARRA